MVPSSESVFTIQDAQQRELGRVEVECRKDGLLTGCFTPAPGFATVARLFRDFEEAVNSQALAVVEKLGATLDALGLELRPPGDSPATAITDVQIYSDGGFSCRLDAPVPMRANGSTALPTQRLVPG